MKFEERENMKGESLFDTLFIYLDVPNWMKEVKKRTRIMADTSQINQ